MTRTFDTRLQVILLSNRPHALGFCLTLCPSSIARLNLRAYMCFGCGREEMNQDEGLCAVFCEEKIEGEKMSERVCGKDREIVRERVFNLREGSP
ncbi:hypothetical protein COLO4_16276 [Corchorus olitorius]|uniref:Uncharacterized protein n=1 Tax=Corchorus olitorius TaxID=93759 RepID=A0A1R3JI64_9ROSI|nr:hypothetical protein COLO4_16276 [Corchorus olitorius]